MLSIAAYSVFSQLLSAPKDSLGKAWLGDLAAASVLCEADFAGAVEELAEQGSVVLSRDDMAQRPDALTVRDCQRIELAKEAE